VTGCCLGSRWPPPGRVGRQRRVDAAVEEVYSVARIPLAVACRAQCSDFVPIRAVGVETRDSMAAEDHTIPTQEARHLALVVTSAASLITVLGRISCYSAGEPRRSLSRNSPADMTRGRRRPLVPPLHPIMQRFLSAEPLGNSCQFFVLPLLPVSPDSRLPYKQERGRQYSVAGNALQCSNS